MSGPPKKGLLARLFEQSWSPIDNTEPDVPFRQGRTTWPDPPPDTEPRKKRNYDRLYVPGEITEHTHANFDRWAAGLPVPPEVAAWAESVAERNK